MTSFSKSPFADLHAYWQAANYLTVGQIYLQDNPLLREPLKPEHIKPRLLGHWGTSPGLNLIVNRLESNREAVGTSVRNSHLRHARPFSPGDARRVRV